MSSLVSACKRLSLLACLGAIPWMAWAQPGFSLEGGEYRIIGPLRGDQVHPHLALNPYGGFLVWQDNATDGAGYGISARRISRNLSGSLGVFRVNEAAAGDQVLPKTALLQNGGAVFVWQSTVGATSKIYARFLNTDGTFATGDVLVGAPDENQQTTPVVACLADGNVVVVWVSLDQERLPDGRAVADGMQGVFAQRFTPAGVKIGSRFQVNSTTPLNQRTPAIAPLENGNFVVVWVSESFRGVILSQDSTGRTQTGAGMPIYSVILCGQIFSTDGARAGQELKLTSDGLICANPDVAATENGFSVVWSGKPNRTITLPEQKDGWDIFGRLYRLDGTAAQLEFRVNSQTYGDQFAPKISSQDGINFVLWTSLDQDGSREGVVARLITADGKFLSREFLVNTITSGSQIYPVIAGTGQRNFLTVWSSFVGGDNSYDLFAQRYGSTPEQTMAAPAAPYVTALSQTRLSVTWPELAGYEGVTYELYVGQSSTPVVLANNSAVITSLQPESTHSFRLAYVLPAGKRSALSESVTGKTWAEDLNNDGLPDDWQARFWGPDSSKWPGANADSDADGATNLQELLAGTNPVDPASVLRVQMISTDMGLRLEWNAQPGSIYQIQVLQESGSWLSIGTPRFAAGTLDSILLAPVSTVSLYRVIKVR
jgi:hypothetical protein